MPWIVLPVSGTHHLGPLDENHERTIGCSHFFANIVEHRTESRKKAAFIFYDLGVLLHGQSSNIVIDR
jgi:hypothetical protein